MLSTAAVVLSAFLYIVIIALVLIRVRLWAVLLFVAFVVADQAIFARAVNHFLMAVQVRYEMTTALTAGEVVMFSHYANSIVAAAFFICGIWRGRCATDQELHARA